MTALYDNESLLQTIFITVVVGGGCAWQMGRSMALTWRPLPNVVVASLLLGAAVRFLHFALFQETLFAPVDYAIETACLTLAALLSWRSTRARQMVQQYYWLYEAHGPLGWRARQDDTPKGG
jgi:hypothetical protein